MMNSFILLLLAATVSGIANAASPSTPAFVTPSLPNGATVVTERSAAFLKAPPTLKSNVTVAVIAPTIDFGFFPSQTYAGKPWSAWGDSTAADGKYYASIGDHLAPGNAFVYEYDPAKKRFR